MEKIGDCAAGVPRRADRSVLTDEAVAADSGADRQLDEREVLARAIGAWSDRGMDSTEYVDRLRSGRRLDDVR